MADIDLASTIRQKIRKITFLKYVIIALMIVAGGSPLLFLSPEVGSNVRALAETALYSGLGAFCLSILNDVVLKAETDEVTKLDRVEFARTFARDFFLEHADNAITSDTLLRLMSSEIRRSDVVRALASLITSDEELRNTVERSYLEPLHRPPRFKSVSATSILQISTPATGNYIWDCKQSMITLVPVSEFRVFVCCDNSVAMKVESSTRATDFVVLLSSSCSSHEAMHAWMKTTWSSP